MEKSHNVPITPAKQLRCNLTNLLREPAEEEMLSALSIAIQECANDPEIPAYFEPVNFLAIIQDHLDNTVQIPYIAWGVIINAWLLHLATFTEDEPEDKPSSMPQHLAEAIAVLDDYPRPPAPPSP